MSATSQRQVKVLHVVPTALVVGDMKFTKGMRITNESALAAYLKCQYQACEIEETSLTVPEILSTWNKVGKATGYDGEELESAVIDAMKSRQAGDDSEDDMPLMDRTQAANRIALAHTLGLKLGEEANNQIVHFIAARKTIKIGPVAMMLVVRQQWTSEEIDAMPMPWSKPEGKNVTVDKSNVQYDIYKTDLGNGPKRGSWFEDTILSLTTPSELETQIENVTNLSEQDKTKDHIAFKKTSQSDLNSATNLLRRAVMLDKVLREIDTFEDLEYQVRMRIDPVTKEKSPATDKADYPILLWQKGDNGNAINLTLNNLMKAFDPATDKSGAPLVPTISRLEAAKAAGGLLEHFKAFVLPKKERGKNAFPAIETPEKFLASMFRQAVYLESGGADRLIRELNAPGEVGQTNLLTFGDVMSVLVPIWINRRGDYENLAPKTKAA